MTFLLAVPALTATSIFFAFTNLINRLRQNTNPIPRGLP